MRGTISNDLLSGRDKYGWFQGISEQDPEDLLVEKPEKVICAASHNGVARMVGLHNLVFVAINVEEAHI